MGSINIRPLVVADFAAAAQLLAASFVDDLGMVTLFKAQETPKLRGSMHVWFSATMGMWRHHDFTMLGAFEGDGLLGVLLASQNNVSLSPLHQFLWALRVGMKCGIAPIVRTIKHDDERQTHVQDGDTNIVEFVAVDAEARGKGVGRKLFDRFHSDLDANASVWLETTRTENLSIFAKLGYLNLGTSISLGVKFTQMRKPAAKESSSAAS